MSNTKKIAAAIAAVISIDSVIGESSHHEQTNLPASPEAAPLLFVKQSTASN